MEMTLNANFLAIENDDLNSINGGATLLSIMCGLGLAVGSLAIAVLLAPTVSGIVALGLSASAAKFLVSCFWAGTCLITFAGFSSAFF